VRDYEAEDHIDLDVNPPSQAYNYAGRLRLLGKERMRLTEQLQAFIALVADEITKYVEAGTVVTVEDVGFMRVNESPKVLLLDGGVEWHTLDVMHDTDFCIATRKEFLLVANHLPEVMHAFEIEQERIIEILREAFGTFTQLTWGEGA
jgi:hypothetical protein